MGNITSANIYGNVIVVAHNDTLQAISLDCLMRVSLETSGNEFVLTYYFDVNRVANLPSFTLKAKNRKEALEQYLLAVNALAKLTKDQIVYSDKYILQTRQKTE